jgi:MFS family permease
VRAGAAVAAVGLGLSLAVGDPLFALVGFASAGVGFSIIFPAALSAAGRTKGAAAGPAIAAVATAGYFGFLIGPPSIGFVAELFGLGGALYMVVALSAAIVLLAGSVGRRTPDRRRGTLLRRPSPDRTMHRAIYNREVMDHMMYAFGVPGIPAAVLTAVQLFVAAVLSWIGLAIYRVSRNPKTPPSDGVILDLGLGLVTVTAAVLWFSASLKVLF